MYTLAPNLPPPPPPNKNENTQPHPHPPTKINKIRTRNSQFTITGGVGHRPPGHAGRHPSRPPLRPILRLHAHAGWSLPHALWLVGGLIVFIRACLSCARRRRLSPDPLPPQKNRTNTNPHSTKSITKTTTQNPLKIQHKPPLKTIINNTTKNRRRSRTRSAAPNYRTKERPPTTSGSRRSFGASGINWRRR